MTDDHRGLLYGEQHLPLPRDGDTPPTPPHLARNKKSTAPWADDPDYRPDRDARPIHPERAPRGRRGRR
ncbi:MAG: hypothetical protein ACRD0W_20555 [Acidimicrobiales bacterium]